MIDVASTRAALRRADVAVVVDVLRATSTVAQAFAAGYDSVLCTTSLKRAAALRAPGRVLAGERDCKMPPGFDQGNSPLDAAQPRGDQLVLTTTNGAPTILAATRHAPRVLLACLLNLESVIAVLREAYGGADCEVQIVCSGTDGAPALEDTYLAGRLSAELPGERTDATLIAEAVARAYSTPMQALNASADARVLRAVGSGPDIAYCAQESLLDVVPFVSSAEGGVATLAGNSRAAHDAPTQKRNSGILQRDGQTADLQGASHGH